MVTAKSISCAYNGSDVGAVKLASIAAMLLVLVIVSFRDDTFVSKVRFMAYVYGINACWYFKNEKLPELIAFQFLPYSNH